MVRLSQKTYDEFKQISDKKGITYSSELEMQQSANNLVRSVELMVELDAEHRSWEQRLEKEPKGFSIPSNGRNCSLCKTGVYGEVWYDKWGMKCMNCQTALHKKIVPGYVFKDKDNQRHITAAQLNSMFGLHPQTIKKLIRQKKLNARFIPNGPIVFLKTDNPNLPDIISQEANITPAD